jgi:hypothetical protein
VLQFSLTERVVYEELVKAESEFEAKNDSAVPSRSYVMSSDKVDLHTIHTKPYQLFITTYKYEDAAQI